MSQVANGVAPAAEDPLSSLAARLPDPHDREWYAALITYIHSLPADDELVKIAQLFGFLTLIGRQLPDVIAAEQTKLRDMLLKAYTALQQEVKTNATYHEKLNERLSKLPEEIAAGVKPEAIAKSMGESFRQQLTQTGLQETGRLLQSSVKELKQVSGALDGVVQPLKAQYSGIASTIDGEVNKLRNAAYQLQHETANLISASRDDRWAWKLGAALFLFATGLLLGIFWEQRSTAALIIDLQAQVNQFQQAISTIPMTNTPATLKHPKKGQQ